MKLNSLPFSSVIVLNYNGEKVIENTVESLLALNYPKDKFEIIIVDNNSQDQSREILRGLSKRYPQIKTVFLEKNFGFGQGNNAGFKVAKGEYVALLNNDCVVDTNWLRKLVETANQNKKIFAVSSKVLLYPKYINLSFRLPKQLILEHVFLSKSGLNRLSKSGKIFLNCLRKNDLYTLELLYDPVSDSNLEIEFSFNKAGKYNNGMGLIFSALNKEDYQLKASNISKEGLVQKVMLDVKSKYFKKHSYNKIQNAGIVMFQDGYGRDIGALVKNNTQYYESDTGQFNKVKEVYAACGAAVLYRRKILDKIGFFDNSFFMYYEDVDLSERARIKGYKIYYAPQAVVRHMHAFSSQEWSLFFIHHTEKGRLLHVFFNFPLRIFIREYLYFILIIIQHLTFLISRLGRFRSVMSGNREGKKLENVGKALQYIKILFFFSVRLPALLLKKLKYGLPGEQIERNYQEIVGGRWYFK